MTPSKLKTEIKKRDPHSSFFDRETMKYFGDTMSNFGVRPTTIVTDNKEVVDCWELYRKKPVNHNLQSSHFFCRNTFRKVWGNKYEV